MFSLDRVRSLEWVFSVSNMPWKETYKGCRDMVVMGMTSPLRSNASPARRYMWERYDRENGWESRNGLQECMGEWGKYTYEKVYERMKKYKLARIWGVIQAHLHTLKQIAKHSKPLHVLFPLDTWYVILLKPNQLALAIPIDVENSCCLLEV